MNDFVHTTDVVILLTISWSDVNDTSTSVICYELAEEDFEATVRTTFLFKVVK